MLFLCFLNFLIYILFIFSEMISKSNHMIEDDLEYHINFPIPEPLEQTDLDIKDKLSSSDKEKDVQKLNQNETIEISK